MQIWVVFFFSLQSAHIQQAKKLNVGGQPHKLQTGRAKLAHHSSKSRNIFSYVLTTGDVSSQKWWRAFRLETSPGENINKYVNKLAQLSLFIFLQHLQLLFIT